MEIIFFSGPEVGSLDWELPPDIADKISKLPIELRTALLKQIESRMRDYLYLLTTALRMGDKSRAAFNLITENSSALSERLIQGVKAGNADDLTIQDIVKDLEKNFSNSEEAKKKPYNIFSRFSKGSPGQFAAGVEIRKVVQFVLSRIKI